MFSTRGRWWSASVLAGLTSVLPACSESEETGPTESPEDIEPSDHPSIVTIAGTNTAESGFADGEATAARFDWPEGLALDRAGENLYIADSRNHAIRRLSLTTLQVSTVAGVGSPGANDTSAGQPAMLHLPRNLVLDASEANLYFTDTNNFVIRRLELATGTVTTEFGGMGEPGTADGPGTEARFGQGGFAPWGGGLALYGSADSGETVLFVADSGNQTVRRIDLETREVTTIAGQRGVEGHADGPGPMALFNKPSGLAVVGGKLYVTEANSLTIRELDIATGDVRTVAGRAPDHPKHFCENISQFIPPECGADDAAVGLDARFRFPFGVALGSNADMFVVDSHNNLVRHFDTVTTAVSTVAGVQQTVLDDIPHASTDSTPEVPGTFWHPTHVAYRPPSTLYVADRSAQCIRKVELKR